ncbi:hypothetical protein H0E87_031513, partial [Populus deltoides]
MWLVESVAAGRFDSRADPWGWVSAAESTRHRGGFRLPCQVVGTANPNPRVTVAGFRLPRRFARGRIRASARGTAVGFLDSLGKCVGLRIHASPWAARTFDSLGCDFDSLESCGVVESATPWRRFFLDSREKGDGAESTRHRGVYRLPRICGIRIRVTVAGRDFFDSLEICGQSNPPVTVAVRGFSDSLGGCVAVESTRHPWAIRLPELWRNHASESGRH